MAVNVGLKNMGMEEEHRYRLHNQLVLQPDTLSLFASPKGRGGFKFLSYDFWWVRQDPDPISLTQILLDPDYFAI